MKSTKKTRLYTFVAGTKVESVKVNGEFDQLVAAHNNAVDDLTELNGTGGAAAVGITSITGVTASDVQGALSAIETQVATHVANVTNPHNVTAAQLNVYTKSELAPYLQGGDTSIKIEAFTIVNSNNGNGTFTYNNGSADVVGQLTAEGYQVFTLKKGVYAIGVNCIEAYINDTLHRSAASGGLQELAADSVALTSPEGAGAEITFKYYQRMSLSGEQSISYGTTQPPVTANRNIMWFKILS